MGRLFGLFLQVILGFLLLCAPLAAAERPVVTAVRAAAHDGVTRFVLEVSEPLTFLVGGVAGKVAVDLPELDWQTQPKGLSRPVGVLRNWTYGPARSGSGRLLLETDGAVGVQKAFIIPPSGNGSYRLVVDLAPGVPPAPILTPPSQTVSAPPPVKPAPPMAETVAPTPGVSRPVMAMTTANPILTAEPAAQNRAEPAAQNRAEPAAQNRAEPVAPQRAAPEPEPVKPASTEGTLKHANGSAMAAGPMPGPALAPPPAPVAIPAAVKLPADPDADGATPRNSRGASGGKPVVVIDPGHGGVDPGAISVSGAYEKNIVLALAHDVKDALDKSGKVRCVLTRDGDTFIPLRERVAIGRARHADLFMSLHADTVADPTIRGLSVYTLSQNSSDAEAQALADKENKSDIVAGLDLSNESAEVTNILIDLVQRESMNKSAVFAAKVIRSVQNETHNVLEANTHRFAGFAVLKAPDVPSVLVETGYLSNIQDEQMLRRSEYRAKLATALARAIENYFAKSGKTGRS